MKDTIDRLFREMRECEQTYYDAGEKEGRAWAKSAHYEDLEIVVVRGPVSEGEFLEEKACEDGAFSEYMEGLHQKYPHLGSPNIHKAFDNGWLKGVFELREEVLGEVAPFPTFFLKRNWGLPCDA